MTSVGAWMQSLLRTALGRHLRGSSSSVIVTSCRQLSTAGVADDVDEAAAAVVDAQRLRATTSSPRADHVDRHVRSSGTLLLLLLLLLLLKSVEFDDDVALLLSVACTQTSAYYAPAAVRRALSDTAICLSVPAVGAQLP